MDNHELSVQVVAHGHRRMEDILRVARSLEAVQKFRPRGHKPSTQVRFVADEREQYYTIGEGRVSTSQSRRQAWPECG